MLNRVIMFSHEGGGGNANLMKGLTKRIGIATIEASEILLSPRALILNWK